MVVRDLNYPLRIEYIAKGSLLAVIEKVLKKLHQCGGWEMGIGHTGYNHNSISGFSELFTKIWV
jgi:hypothetical protein